MQRTGFYVLGVTLMMLTTIPGCAPKNNNQGFNLQASTRNQIRSLSLKGRDFASVVVEKAPGDRELLPLRFVLLGNEHGSQQTCVLDQKNQWLWREFYCIKMMEENGGKGPRSERRTILHNDSI